VFQTLNVKCFNYCRIHKLFFLKSCDVSMLQLIARLTWERIPVNIRKVKDITVIPIANHQYSPVLKLVTSILLLGKWKFIFKFWLVHSGLVVFIPHLILFFMVIHEEQSLDWYPIALNPSWWWHVFAFNYVHVSLSQHIGLKPNKFMRNWFLEILLPW